MQLKSLEGKGSWAVTEKAWKINGVRQLKVGLANQIFFGDCR